MSKLRGDGLAMIFQEPMTSLNPAYTIGSQMAEVLERHRGVSRARRSTVPLNCSAASASPRRGCGLGNIHTSFPADCASA